MLKVLKFGGSSMADAQQLSKVRSIVESDPSRRVVVVSAAGKRFKNDHKITDLLYLCHAHLQYGVSCDAVFDMVRSRYLEIRDELELSTPLEQEFDALRQKMDKGISADELVSRGEYFAARLMADYLGFDFLDSTMWLHFRMDGTVDQEVSYQALQRAASGRRVVIPGFYGVLPDGSIHTFSRGGSDITGALAAAALDADVYENWTDVAGFLMADPKSVPDPRAIERITYEELRELIYKAKASNVPNDNIDRAIKKAMGADSVQYEEITYEGYGPSGVAVIVETTTDSRNRTASDVRHFFDKYGGNLGSSGCVSYMFEDKGVIVLLREDNEKVDEDQLMEDALEAGAEDFSSDEDSFQITTEPSDVYAIRDALAAKGYKIESAEEDKIPNTYVTLEAEEDIKNMTQLIEHLEDSDDVQEIYHNWENCD